VSRRLVQQECRAVCCQHRPPSGVLHRPSLTSSCCAGHHRRTRRVTQSQGICVVASPGGCSVS
jgi:hypothetical protein